MIKIKQMSLVALGAATLFMAPTVVHADDDSDSQASVTLQDTGYNQITSAPDLNFNVTNNKMGNDPMTQATLEKDVKVEVDIKESEQGWNLDVSRSSFEGKTDHAIGKTFKGEELSLLETGKEQKGPGVAHSETPSYEMGEIFINNPRSILTATGHSVGTHSLNFAKDGIELKVPMYYPSGKYESTVLWTLTNTP